MSANRAPGVLVQHVDPPPAIEPVRVDVAAFVCVCERGPVGEPVRLGSWLAFERVFGGFIGNGLGAYAVKAYFDQGGRVCWVIRAAAPEATTTTSGPQPVGRRSSVVASLAGFVPGAAATVRQAGHVHTYLVTGVDAATSTLHWDRPLHPDFDVALGLDVGTGAGRARASLADAAGAPALEVSARTPGAWGDRLEVRITPGRRAATRNRPEEPSDGTATPVASTAGFAVGDRVRVSQEVAGVVAETEAVVDRVDHVRRVLWWTGPLPAALVPGLPLALESSTFTLAVLESGVPVETWPDLSVLPAHPRFAPEVVAASPRIDLTVPGAAEPAPGRSRLRGGRDGTAALTVADLIGDEILAPDGSGVGLAALVAVAEPAVIALPDLVGAPTPARVLDPPPEPDPCDPCAEPADPAREALEAKVVEAGARFDVEDVVAAQHAVIESCERNTERIVLLDPPAADGPLPLADLRSWAGRFASSYAVAVAPWVTVVDPLAVARVRRVPACGHLAGLIAQVDSLAGPWLTPANRTLAWAHGLDADLTEDEHAVANEAGIVIVRALPGRGLVPMGARTLSADTPWLFLAVRRAMIHLRRSLRHYLAWVVFEPDDAALARTVTTAIATLLTGVWEGGGLAGGSPEEAFALHVEPQGRAGRLLIVVGVALARPAEFVTVRVSRTDNRLEVSEHPELVLAGGAGRG